MPDTTPTTDLRAAAALLREAASHATSGPWRTHDTWIDHGGHTATVLTDRPDINDTELVAWLPTMSNQPWDEARNAWRNAGWIALMGPGVGLALAEWLDSAAEDALQIGPGFRALDVARRVLGTTDQQPETENDEQRADREETERDHAAGDHEHCGVTCKVEMPTEHLRNFVIAKGYPGTKGALDELLRRAADQQPETAPTAPAEPCTEHPNCYTRTWEQRANISDSVTTHTKALLTRRTETLRKRAERAEAERDCLVAVMFARQWKPDAPMSLRDGIDEILATMPSRLADEAQQPETGLPPEQPCTDPRHTGAIREQLGCNGPDPATQAATNQQPR